MIPNDTFWAVALVLVKEMGPHGGRVKISDPVGFEPIARLDCMITRCWLLQDAKAVLPWVPSHMLHKSPATTARFTEEYDSNGDSYTQDLTVDALQHVFSKIDEQVHTCFFYKDKLCKNTQAEICPKIKNELRTITRLKFWWQVQEFYLIVVRRLKCTCKFTISFLPNCSFHFFKKQPKTVTKSWMLPCVVNMYDTSRIYRLFSGQLSTVWKYLEMRTI